MNNTKDKLTLAIIPCYNEAATIGSIALKVKNHVDKVLVIDDGSIDDTVKIAKAAGAIVISHKKNYGKSTAIKSGFKYALDKNYDYIITLDGDGQHDPSEIPLLLNNLKNNGHDITLGIRYGNNTEMPIWRKFGKRILDYTVSLGNGGFVTDTQCGFRAFNKKAVENILPRLKGRSFCVESEQIIRAHETGLKIDSEHISCRYENLDASTKSPVSHGLSVLAYTIWLLAERRPLVFLTLPGFIFTVLGFLLGFGILLSYTQTNILNIFHLIIASILLIIGIIICLIGLLNVLPGIIRKTRLKKE